MFFTGNTYKYIEGYKNFIGFFVQGSFNLFESINVTIVDSLQGITRISLSFEEWLRLLQDFAPKKTVSDILFENPRMRYIQYVQLNLWRQRLNYGSYSPFLIKIGSENDPIILNNFYNITAEDFVKALATILVKKAESDLFRLYTEINKIIMVLNLNSSELRGLKIIT